MSEFNLEAYYSDMLRTTRTMLGDLSNLEKRLVSKGFDQFLINHLQSIDMYGIIRCDDDFQKFKKDLLNN